MTEFEKSYVFEPSQARPAKRRKVEYQGLQASWPIRQAAFRQSWERQQLLIDQKLELINATTISDVTSFLDNTAISAPDSRIPTGIISTGPDAASQRYIFDHLAASNNRSFKRVVVSVSATTGSNLKTLLKMIIQQATLRQDGIDDEDGEEDRAVTTKGSRMLNYDLQILADFVHERNVEQIVLAFHDTEAFDGGLLSQLIESLSIWHDRIPFIILLSVATSLDFLQQRLSKEAVKALQGQIFNTAPTEDVIEQIFEAITDQTTLLRIGPNLMHSMLERQGDYIQSIDSLISAVRYANMSHYYANALSIFLDPMLNKKDVGTDHYKALRNLPSFQTYCDWLSTQKQPLRLSDLLEEDEVLFGAVSAHVSDGRRQLNQMVGAITVLRVLQKHLAQQQVMPKSKLYVQALSNKLRDSTLIRNLMLSLRKASSSVVMEIITELCQPNDSADIDYRCEDLKSELEELVNSAVTQEPLRSEHDVKNSTLRTTVVAQKVELSKQKSTLSKQDAAYTKILHALTKMLEAYFQEKFIDPTSMVLHEIFLYDLKSPYREVFTPRPRHAIERALAAPQDYLACECCQTQEGFGGEEAVLSPSLPATAVLYQLYLESGSLINASDLWQAFRAVVGDERSGEQNMALFQRALAELKYLGVVKGTRKKVDHIAKVAWRGL